MFLYFAHEQQQRRDRLGPNNPSSPIPHNVDTSPSLDNHSVYTARTQPASVVSAVWSWPISRNGPDPPPAKPARPNAEPRAKPHEHNKKYNNQAGIKPQTMTQAMPQIPALPPPAEHAISRNMHTREWDTPSRENDFHPNQELLQEPPALREPQSPNSSPLNRRTKAPSNAVLFSPECHHFSPDRQDEDPDLQTSTAAPNSTPSLDVLLTQTQHQLTEHHARLNTVKTLHEENETLTTTVKTLLNALAKSPKQTVNSRSQFCTAVDDVSLTGSLVSQTSAGLASTTSQASHKCFACDLISKFIEQNDLLRNALSEALKDKAAFLSSLTEAERQMEHEKEAQEAGRRQMRDIQRLLDRFERQFEEQKREEMERQLLSQGELDKRSEKDGAEILELRRQLMEQFEANKALISENSELSDHNLKLTSSVSELKGFREELAKKKAKHDVKQVARETQTENESVEIGVGLDEKGEALLRAAAFAEGEGNRASVATETTSEIEILCTKCESKKELTVAVKSPKGAAKKAARTPKARIILEAKVLQMMYEILEKKILFDEAELTRALTPKKGGGEREAGKKLPMTLFLKNHFEQKYGISGNMAAQQQANFMASLTVYKQHNTRIQHFLTLCGLLNEEVYCPAIESLYLDVIRALMGYSNYEGISERLDDGLGQVKMSKKVAANALLGSGGKVGNQATWKCTCLVKCVGVAAVKLFYTKEIGDRFAGANELDYDDFTEALLGLLLEGLERQLLKVKEVLEGRELEDGMGLRIEEFGAAVAEIAGVGVVAAAKVGIMYMKGREQAESVDEEGDEVVVDCALLAAVLLQEGLVCSVTVNKNVETFKKAGRLSLMLGGKKGGEKVEATADENWAVGEEEAKKAELVGKFFA